MLVCWAGGRGRGWGDTRKGISNKQKLTGHGIASFTVLLKKQGMES